MCLSTCETPPTCCHIYRFAKPTFYPRHRHSTAHVAHNSLLSATKKLTLCSDGWAEPEAGDNAGSVVPRPSAEKGREYGWCHIVATFHWLPQPPRQHLGSHRTHRAPGVALRTKESFCFTQSNFKHNFVYSVYDKLKFKRRNSSAKTPRSLTPCPAFVTRVCNGRQDCHHLLFSSCSLADTRRKKRAWKNKTDKVGCVFQTFLPVSGLCGWTVTGRRTWRGSTSPSVCGVATRGD